MAKEPYGGPWGRTPRNIPTGPGSRGGHWHEPAFRKAWWKQYRIDNPGYGDDHKRRQMERRRQALIRREIDDACGVTSMSQVLRIMVQEEPYSGRELAHRIGVSDTTIQRFKRDEQYSLYGDSYDAMVAYFGLWSIGRRWAKIKRDRRGV